MYYPKSHITSNLYSNGDLNRLDSGKPYTGYYFTTIDNRAFTGRFPEDGPNDELLFSFSTPGEVEFDEVINYKISSLDTFTYTTLNNIPVTETTLSPTPFYPQPSEQDYSRGEFTRYFAKKTNENIYTEVSGLFQNSLYIGIKLPWLITGDEDKVYNTNKNIVELREQENQIEGLGYFLRFNYLKFYK